MDKSIIETSYPLDFRENETSTLGQHLRHKHSVELVGMKRVGISNFLRFFLYRMGIVEKYINKDEVHLFIAVDLNDLVERELYPFWILTFKRVVDRIEEFKLSTPELKKEISTLFLDCIQSQDLFLSIENLKKALNLIVTHNMHPTLFLLRFDRLNDAVSPAFFDNLQGLKDATNNRLSYVFTSFRGLDELSPTVFPRKSLAVFSDLMYIKPANHTDSLTILETFEKRYNVKPQEAIREELVRLSGGHVQYLQIGLLSLNHKVNEITDPEGLLPIILQDERTTLQSEEIWESLTEDEQRILIKIAHQETITNDENTRAKYLFDTGIACSENGKAKVFSPFLENYVSQKGKPPVVEKEDNTEFTKKEHKLYSFLSENIGAICEREKIIEMVWPEYAEFGVSDWAVDRLVARLRSKLKKKKSTLEIVTIKTRGYKMIEKGQSS